LREAIIKAVSYLTGNDFPPKEKEEITMAKSPKSKPKSDVFKTRKTREPEQVAGDTITPPAEIAQAIDAFRDAQEQAKHFEGEATVQKDAINDYSLGEFAKRSLKGKNHSFKLLGEQSMVTYVVMDASAGLTEEDVEAFKERWGEKAADDLIARDFASIRFDGEVLEANYEAVVEALQTLPKDVLENLFKPMLLKAKKGAVERAKNYAKSPQELRELIQQLKIRNYIR
jgi:hypothetical protein